MVSQCCCLWRFWSLALVGLWSWLVCGSVFGVKWSLEVLVSRAGWSLVILVSGVKGSLELVGLWNCFSLALLVSGGKGLWS